MKKITKARTHIVVAMDTEPVPSLRVRDALAVGILKKYANELAKILEAKADENDQLGHDDHVYAYSDRMREAAKLIRHHDPERDD